MEYTDQEIHDWKSAPWRPNGTHELAHLPHADVSPDALAVHASIDQSGQLVNGADTIRDALGLLPVGLGTYSSYVDNFEGIVQLLAMRGRLNPAAVYFSYTIFGNPANFGDVEPGALHVSDVPHFLDHLAIPLPGASAPAGLYYSASIAHDVIAAAAGRPFIRMSAHYGAGPHICGPATCGFPQADGTQWDDKGPNGENYDREVFRGGVLGGAVPKPPEDAVSIAVSANPDGRLEAFVHCTDGSVKHTWQVSPGGSWKGEDPKKKSQAAWFPLGNPGK